MVAMNCLHELIEAQARRTPQHPALAFEGHTLTYAELERRTGALAAELARLGAGPDVLVGLLVERSLEMVIGILGILKAGAAYVPMDPGYPPDRLAFMLSDSGAKLLVTQSGLSAKLPSHGVQVVRLDELDWSGPQQAPKNVAGPENLAYVIYTERLDGPAEGRGHRAPQHRQLRARRRRTAAARARHEPRDGVDRRRRPRQHRDFPGARHGRLPACPVAGTRREPGAARRLPQPRAHRRPEDRALAPRCAAERPQPRARHARAPPDPRRRGLAPRLDRAAARRRAAVRDLQPLRPDRDHRRRADLPRRRGAPGDAIAHPAARTRPARQQRLPPRPGGQARARGRERRALHRRPRRGARLP